VRRASFLEASWLTVAAMQSPVRELGTITGMSLGDVLGITKLPTRSLTVSGHSDLRWQVFLITCGSSPDWIDAPSLLHSRSQKRRDPNVTLMDESEAANVERDYNSRINSRATFYIIVRASDTRQRLPCSKVGLDRPHVLNIALDHHCGSRGIDATWKPQKKRLQTWS
jgi:hypothetical protein